MLENHQLQHSYSQINLELGLDMQKGGTEHAQRIKMGKGGIVMNRSKNSNMSGDSKPNSNVEDADRGTTHCDMPEK